MPLKILKRVNEPARSVHVILRELLVYSLGWGDVEVNPAAAFEMPELTGGDGETSSAQPTVFRSAAGGFLGSHVGMYLTIYGSHHVNNGVYKIVGVPSSTELVLQGGLYGASLIDDLNVDFRIVDPTLNAAGNNYYVVRAKSGSSPLWEMQVEVALGITNRLDIEVSPLGGWNAGWSMTALPAVSIEQDATPLWYILVEDSYVRMWTENAAGTAVHELAYLGAGETLRPASDARFVVSAAGDPSLSNTGALADVQSLDSALANVVSYSAIVFGDNVSNNMFDSLTSSPFDLRNDFAGVPVGTDQVGFEEDNRGYLRGIGYISDQIPYRSFVDNGRALLSLGNGLAIHWDGSLPR